MQDEIDAVKGSLANYLTKSDAEATYATKTTVESLSQLLNQIKANYVSAEGLASTLEGYVTDAELADYPTLTVLQEAIRQSETAMKNSLGEAMEPILAKYNFVQKDVLDLEIQDLQEQIDALNGKPDADGSLANIKSRLEALENAEIKYDESNAAFTKGVEDCIGKALANDGKINEAIANAINGVAGEYEGTMQDLKNLIDGLRMDVDQLLSRIQSLVYVPAYDDHKASVTKLIWEVRTMSNILEVKDLNVSYGGIKAVKDISFAVPKGEVVTLIGANGAGKSSTLRSIVGLVKPESGSILLKGEELAGMPTEQIVTKGITLVPEGRRVFPDMTVAENLKIGAYMRKDSLDEDMNWVYDLFPSLKERSWQLAGTLSGGEQQMLAIGRALMSRPEIIMMDEPSLGLAPIIVKGVFDIIREINKQGVTILLVEQNANMALKAANLGYVMETGRITLSGTGAELLENEAVKAAYLGKAKK